jgi:hypothetical protein
MVDNIKIIYSFTKISEIIEIYIALSITFKCIWVRRTKRVSGKSFKCVPTLALILSILVRHRCLFLITKISPTRKSCIWSLSRCICVLVITFFFDWYHLYYFSRFLYYFFRFLYFINTFRCV